MITVRSTINIAHQSVPEVIPAVQGDTGRSILFTLADFTIPAGATARYFITKPSGLAVYNDATIDGETVLVDLTAQSLAEYGDCPGQVRISVGDAVVTSFEFILHVEPFRGIDAVESSTETNIFDKAVEDAREAIAEAAEEAEEYISQALDTTLTIENKAADAKATGDAIWSIFPTESAQGNPASFDDGADNIPVKDLKVSIVPNQDLHGYDKPWAGGAGKNLLPMTVAGIKAANTNGTWSGNVYTLNGVTFTLQTDSAENILGVRAHGTASAQTQFVLCHNKSLASGTYALSGATSGGYSAFWINTYNFTTSSNIADNLNGANSFTLSQDCTFKARIHIASGASVSNVMFYPMIRPSAVSDATFAPYTNECPITGMDEVTVERTGKNLIPMTVAGIKAENTSGTWNGNAYTLNGVTFTLQTDSGGNILGVRAHGTASAQTQFVLCHNKSLASGTYALSGATSGGYSAFWINTYNITTSSNIADNLNGVNSFILSQDCTFRARIYIANGAAVSNVIFYPMIRLSTDSATFEPYHTPQTLSTDLGRTVYGATLDVTTGLLTVDMVSVDLGTLNDWGYNSTYSLFTATISNSASVTSTGLRNVICDRYPTYYTGSAINLSNIPDKSIVMNTSSMSQNNKIVIIKDSTYTDAATFKTAMSGAQLVYELATPQTYQLTPQELLSVLGTNHISTDAESVEVEYRADIQLYIEQLTKPEEDDLIANQAIEAGKFFMIGNRLFLSTASIANGATITPGTNATELSLAEALNTLNS